MQQRRRNSLRLVRGCAEWMCKFYRNWYGSCRFPWNRPTYVCEWALFILFCFASNFIFATFTVKTMVWCRFAARHADAADYRHYGHNLAERRTGLAVRGLWHFLSVWRLRLVEISPPLLLTAGRKRWPNQDCLVVSSCLGLFSFIASCIVLCCDFVIISRAIVCQDHCLRNNVRCFGKEGIVEHLLTCSSL